MSVSFHPWQSTWLEEDPSLVPKLEKAKEKPDQRILVLWNQAMVALMMIKLSLQQLPKIVLNVVLLSLSICLEMSPETKIISMPFLSPFIIERRVKLPPIVIRVSRSQTDPDDYSHVLHTTR